MKTLIKLSLVLTCITLLYSCKKSDTPAPLKTYVSKITTSAGSTFLYTYDAQGRPQRETYSSGSPSNAYSIDYTQYDAQGRVLESVTHFPSGSSPDSRAVTTYDAAGNITRIYFFSHGSTTYSDFITYTYTTGKITIKFFDNATNLTGQEEYILTADGKNNAEVKFYIITPTPILARHDVYTYDTRINTDQLFPDGFKGSPKNANNPASLARTNTGSPVANSTFSYTYNSDGYVTKRTSSSGATIDYEYIKQ